MAKNESPKSIKARFDLGNFLKGLLRREKTPATGLDSAKQTIRADGEEEKLQREPGKSQRPRPSTTAAIQVSPEERIFQSLVIVGPPSGALHNMEQILQIA